MFYIPKRNKSAYFFEKLCLIKFKSRKEVYYNIDSRSGIWKTVYEAIRFLNLLFSVRRSVTRTSVRGVNVRGSNLKFNTRSWPTALKATDSQNQSQSVDLAQAQAGFLGIAHEIVFIIDCCEPRTR